MDEKNVSFQMFLILLSFITLGSESQISVFKQCQKQHLDVCFGGEHAQKPKFGVEKNSIRHFARFNF